MRLATASGRFAVVVALAAAFVLWSSQGLPPVVASHFGAAGAANGFMTKGFYVRFMLALVIGLPALMVVLTALALGRPNARINLPNPGYWLAPERRAETIAYLQAGVAWMGTLILAFLCYAHWLVVLANRSQPARLAESWLIGGLVVFFVGLIALLGTLFARFRKPA